MSNLSREYTVQVAVPVPIRQIYDYLAPRAISPGVRVVVPFGKRTLIGMVVSNNVPSTELQLKPVKEILESDRSINENLMGILKWAAKYYHHPLGEVISTALPGRLRSAKSLADPQLEVQYRSVQDIPQTTMAIGLTRAPRQLALYEKLTSDVWRSADQIKQDFEEFNNSTLGGLLVKLIEKGLVESREFQISVTPLPVKQFTAELTVEQQAVIQKVAGTLNKFKSFVLHGITGSGKTEIYLQLAARCIEKSKQVMVLIPEIALTPQLVDRFTERFGTGVCLIHSAMTDKNRYRAWWQARSGSATVVLGTRSAIFTPLKNPGLFIVDEEHDISYKQQDGFRYHARDLAIKRASIEQVPVILGSATPSMESMNNTDLGRHQILQLTERIGDAKLPSVELIDSKIFPINEGISAPLMQSIRETLDQKQQIILYINRRGFAPIAQCRECAWQAKCDRCDAFLTYHRKTNTFRCHHCSKIIKALTNCTNCNDSLVFAGVGTQRIEDGLREHFPETRIVRFDRDEINNQQKLENTLSKINNGEIDIVIGTQLISKGHDFPGVTLVGVINPDQGLYSVDFRAPEYLFQQMVQVAGRAGRGSAPGKVIIQTAHPDNPYLYLIQKHDFDRFYHFCSEDRKSVGLPPFGYIALWRAESTTELAGLKFLQFVKLAGESIMKKRNFPGISIMDPVGSPMEKLAGRYRAQLLVKSLNRKHLHDLISPWLRKIEKSPQARKVRWSMDIDPMEMY